MNRTHQTLPGGPGDAPRRYSKKWMSTKARNFCVDWLGEYIGTTMFLFFAFSGTEVVRANATDTVTTTLYIALVFGFSLAVNVWIFYRVSGGFFNPAITFAFVLAGKIPPLKGLVHFVAQMLGGMTASGMVRAMFPGPFDVGTKLDGGTSTAQGLFIEMFLTAELVFTVFMLAAEKHRATFLAPVGIGLALFVIELSGVAFTGGSVNPTRSFGPCVVAHSFPKIHWIYWLGPAMGSVLATVVYKILKGLEYNEANPGQDANADEKLCMECHQRRPRHQNSDLEEQRL